jgi:aspartate ammonia-lyase
VKDNLIDLLGTKLPANKLADCLRIEAESGQTLDKIILRKGLMAEEELLEILAKSSWASPIARISTA